jgi:hypothetical protein
MGFFDAIFGQPDVTAKGTLSTNASCLTEGKKEMQRLAKGTHINFTITKTTKKGQFVTLEWKASGPKDAVALFRDALKTSRIINRQ